MVIAAGSDLNITGLVNVNTITIEGDATIEGSGTLAVSSGSITVLAGMATIDVANYRQRRRGEGGVGHARPHVALAAGSLIVGGQAIGPGAVFGSTGQSLEAIDPAMFSLVQSLFVDQSIDRAAMIEILDSAVENGAVSDDALAALEAITTPESEAALNVPNYVAVLASDVVNGNPANANYQGQPLGDLADQDSQQAMATA